YSMLYSPYTSKDMAKIYNALDVLLNPSMCEGFGIPVLEAHACGVPAIVTDYTAMPQVCGAGWHVGYEPYWTPLNSWAAMPHLDEIVDALEECYGLSTVARTKLSTTARRWALQYDTERVYREHWRPTLRAIEQRFGARQPIHIPSRLKAA